MYPYGEAPPVPVPAPPLPIPLDKPPPVRLPVPAEALLRSLFRSDLLLLPLLPPVPPGAFSGAGWESQTSRPNPSDPVPPTR